MSVPTGVKRLDDVLGGGVPPRSTTLIIGPSYTGKHVLAGRFALAGLAQGQPAVLALTDEGADAVSRRLAALDDQVPAYEDDGLLRYVDAYSRTIGADEDHPAADYVDGLVNLNDLARIMNQVQRDLLADHDAHRLVFDSLTTLVVETNARTAFRVLQVLLGRTRQAGGTSLLVMDAGVHEPSEIELVKHLTDGVLETRKAADGDGCELRVEGLGLNQPPGWAPYSWSEDAFEVTGSFVRERVG